MNLYAYGHRQRVKAWGEGEGEGEVGLEVNGGVRGGRREKGTSYVILSTSTKTKQKQQKTQGDSTKMFPLSSSV